MSADRPPNEHERDRMDGPTLEEAMQFFRAERCGELMFDEHVRPLKFITDNESGHIVAPVMVAALEAAHQLLYVPEEGDDAMQMLLTLEKFDGENHPDVDRWRIYHGEPEDVRWARAHIESVRWGPMVFDGDAFMIANPLKEVEPRICKKLNADRELLRRICKNVGHAQVAEPVCVGVDPDGLHIRAHFGVNRVYFEKRAESAEEAEEFVEALVKQAGVRE